MSRSPAASRPVAALSPALEALARRGVERAFAKDAIVLSEGDVGDTLFVILRGSVKVFAMDEAGREITYGTIAAGDYFGEMSLDGGPRSASVMTLEPTLCSVVTSGAVREHLEATPAFAMDLITQIIKRARTATESARSMALLDVYRRLARHLESIEGPGRAAQPLVLHGVTHQDLAARVGASREMVSRLLKDLERGGYVSLATRRITLLKKLPARW